MISLAKQLLSFGVVLAAAGVLTDTANAQVRITEIWQRGNAGTTPDWFELTNISGAAIDPSTYYYDDDSGDPTVDARLTGVTNLEPGESAVYLVSWHDDFPGPGFPPPFDPSDAQSAFESFWGTNGAYQVGYIVDPDSGGGPGLGGGGDAVFIFDSNVAGTLPIDSKAYSGTNMGGETWVYSPATGDLAHAQVGVLKAFLSVDGSQIGSPGVFVPEPGSILLALFAAAAATLGRSRVPGR